MEFKCMRYLVLCTMLQATPYFVYCNERNVQISQLSFSRGCLNLAKPNFFPNDLQTLILYGRARANNYIRVEGIRELELITHRIFTIAHSNNVPLERKG